MSEYQILITKIIYLELNPHQIDQDMDNLLNTSSKEELEELAKKAEGLKDT